MDLFSFLFEAQPKGFSFAVLSQLYEQNDETFPAEDYVNQFFPQEKLMGSGSSRQGYRLDSKKILKIVYETFKPKEAGIAQNLVEVRLSSKFPNLLTKIYAHHPKGYYIVSELVRPVKDIEEINNWFGIDFEYFMFDSEAQIGKIYDFVDEALTGEYFALSEFREFLTGFIKQKRYRKEFIANQKESFKIDKSDIKFIQGLLNQLVKYERNGIDKELETLNKQPAGRELIEVLKLIEPGDVGVLEHWGKTADGRIVLLDYGYDETTRLAHYGGQQ